MEKVASDMEKTTSSGKTTAKEVVLELIRPTGIVINGEEPWDVQVHNDEFYARVLHEGALGLGESYMDKWWDCERLDLLFYKILRASLETKVEVPMHFKIKLLLAKIINFQTKRRSKQVAYKHYNLGNQLFMNMLDTRMIYSCGYFKNAKTLDEAQEAKLDLICQKLDLKPGQRLLDIGCGWGGLAKYAAEKYKVSVVGITISKEQCEFGKEYCKGLPIDIRLQDYRDINEKFDRVVSVGMFEHVGFKNYRTFMQVAHRCLSDDGLFLLHTIGSNEESLFANAWISKYIFPNGNLPSIAQIGKAAEKLFCMEDWHNFSAFYDNTLMAWHDNFTRNWDKLKHKSDERFYRMWTYYLLSCAGSFRARVNQLWQIVFSKRGVIGGYFAPR